MKKVKNIIDSQCNEQRMQGIIEQQEEIIKRQAQESLDDKAIIKRQAQENADLQVRYDEVCKKCESEKTRADFNEKMNARMLEHWSKKHEVIIQGASQLEIQSHKFMSVDDGPPVSTSITTPESPIADHAKPQNRVLQFAKCVIDIFETAASKNNQVVHSKAKGRITPYTYYIDNDCLKRAMNRLVQEQNLLLQDYLDTSETLQSRTICHFVGSVIRLQIINDKKLQITDILFAFQKYGWSPNTVRSRLCETPDNAALDELMRFFKNILEQEKRK